MSERQKHKDLIFNRYSEKYVSLYNESPAEGINLASDLNQDLMELGESFKERLTTAVRNRLEQQAWMGISVTIEDYIDHVFEPDEKGQVDSDTIRLKILGLSGRFRKPGL